MAGFFLCCLKCLHLPHNRSIGDLLDFCDYEPCLVIFRVFAGVIFENSFLAHVKVERFL